MVFSSSVFLFLFLPLTLIAYYLLPRGLRNGFLLAASLLFYAWGEVYYVYIILLSILLNYGCGRLLEWADRGEGRERGWILAGGIAVNLALLVYFKYVNFLLDQINRLLAEWGAGGIDFTPVHLPLGISFFTFQAISYLVDVYRRETTAQRNLFDAALYIALFPQLIAGPIVRYHDVADQIRTRHRESVDLFASGIQRFVFGLAKKMLIANPLGEVADQIMDMPAADLTTGVAWLGIICYGLQIYFDFSAYSDMAIGLGRMFGFRFLENFNYPYVSQSIQEFWRRWHISLSTWFRDYLYIPLGGNRKGPWRTYFNLALIFILCGLWHGANWNFLVWGLLHGSYLVIERLGLARLIAGWWRPLRHFYTLLLVTVAWVFFRIEEFEPALAFLAAMVGQAEGDGGRVYLAMYLDANVGLTLLAGLLLSMPVYPWLRERLAALGSGRSGGVALLAGGGLRLAWLGLLFTLSSAHIAANTYNPFIYFRF